MAESADSKAGDEKPLGLIKNVQTAITFVVGIGALFTATGFIIVKTYLAKFTDIAGYNIQPTQYLTAGIVPWTITGIIVGLVALITTFFATSQRGKEALQKELETREKKAKLTAQLDELNHIYPELNSEIDNLVYQLEQMEKEQKKSTVKISDQEHEKLYQAYEELRLRRESKIVEINRNAREQEKITSELAALQSPGLRSEVDRILERRRSQAISCLGLFLTVSVFIMASVIYGASIYGNTDRAIGGGKPSNIIITFKSDVTPVFGFAMDTRYSSRTGTLLLLAELTDGLLVADTVNGRIVAVKNELIASIFDDEIKTTLIPTGIATASGTPDTPVPTETYLPTSTPPPTFTPVPSETPTLVATQVTIIMPSPIDLPTSVSLATQAP